MQAPCRDGGSPLHPQPRDHAADQVQGAQVLLVHVGVAGVGGVDGAQDDVLLGLAEVDGLDHAPGVRYHKVNLAPKDLVARSRLAHRYHVAAGNFGLHA